MIRYLMSVATAALFTATCAPAQDLSAIARVDVTQSGVETGWLGGASFALSLSQGVPFRVFTLDAPRRLVIDFREVDWSGVRADDLHQEQGPLSSIRFGNFQPGWSRLVATLTKPVVPDDIGMTIDDTTGRALLQMGFKDVTEAEFAARSGAPQNALWPDPPAYDLAAPVADDRFVVVLDPGHGGVDPGAEREGHNEKKLMLQMALELREALLRADDMDVILTRDRDVFVSLEGRVALAHQVGADLFLSLHADALSQGGAQGATIYTLSDAASDTATAHLAARHNRADVIAGTDLTGSDDEVASVLLDLARQETEPRSQALARALVDGLTEAGGPMNNRPLRSAGFSVLKSADIPSVLVEVGFLSSARDLKNLRDPTWRVRMVTGIVRSVLAWRDGDDAKRPLVRQ
ncbi:N-acetylmuramoyl-L-alanine amidase [Roseobacter sp.]|uniref:N-acetylmuramoyl-L-alanine amidase n=1 Tax=Roseobacter sp. TaxID=1907202 RepID=UPI003296FF4D